MNYIFYFFVLVGPLNDKLLTVNYFYGAFKWGHVYHIPELTSCEIRTLMFFPPSFFGLLVWRQLQSEYYYSITTESLFYNLVTLVVVWLTHRLSESRSRWDWEEEPGRQLQWSPVGTRFPLCCVDINHTSKCVLHLFMNFWPHVWLNANTPWSVYVLRRVTHSYSLFSCSALPYPVFCLSAP